MPVCLSDSYALAACNPAYCGILAGVVLDLFCALNPALKRRQLDTFCWPKLWLGFYLNNAGGGQLLLFSGSKLFNCCMAQAVAGLLPEQRRWAVNPHVQLGGYQSALAGLLPEQRRWGLA